MIQCRRVAIVPISTESFIICQSLVVIAGDVASETKVEYGVVQESVSAVCISEFDNTLLGTSRCAAVCREERVGSYIVETANLCCQKR